MSFLGRMLGGGSGGGGGGALGAGHIVLGAETAVFRNTVKSALRGAATDVKTFATEADVAGARASAGINRIGTAAQTSSAKVAAASRTGTTAMRAGAAEAEAVGKRWTAVFSLIHNAAKIGFLGVVGAIGLGVKSAADFQKQWAAVVKTVGGTPAQMSKLRSDILGLSTAMPTGLKDLASIAETAGALGVPIGQVKEFTRVVAMLGATTNVSVDQAATSLGQLGNVLNLRQKDYERFASTLVDLGNKGASTEKQILDITTRAGAAGKLLGLRTDEILAIASTTASLGINPEAGGTALQKTFIQLLKITNTDQKAGTDGARKLAEAQDRLHIAQMRLNAARAKAHPSAIAIASAELSIQKAQDGVAKASVKAKDVQADLAKVAGMTVTQWKELVKNDPGAAFQRFVAGIGKLTQADQLAALKEFGLAGTNNTRTILGLANGQGELARQMGIAESAWKANTALQENYRKKTENLIDRLKILFNVINVALIKLGDMVLPVITKIVDAIAKGLPGALNTASNIWNAFWTKVKGPIGSVVAAVGRLVAAFQGPDAGKPLDWAKAIGSAFDGLANVIVLVANALSMVIDAGAKFVASPIGQWAKNILVPLAAVVVALKGLQVLATKLTGWSTGILKGVASLLPGLPKFGGGQAKTPEAQALMGSAGKLDHSAAALERAAGALHGGALGGLTPQQRQLATSVANLPGGGAISGIAPQPLTRPMTLQERMAYAGTANLDTIQGAGFRYPRVPIGTASPSYGWGQGGMNPNRLTSVPLANKAEYLANQRSFDSAGRSLIGQAQVALASGARSAAGIGSDIGGRIRGAASGAGTILKGAGSLLAKAFWPLMIADMATEFLKQPISEFVAQNTPFKNAAAEMSKDFWGGARDLLIAAFNGTDAWVGHAELTTIGTAKISTLTIAKLGFNSAQIGAMQAPTLANGGFGFQQSADQVLREQYGKMSPAEIISAAATSGIDVSKYDFMQNVMGAGGKNLGGFLKEHTGIPGVSDFLTGAGFQGLAGNVLDTFGLKGAVENAGLTQKDVQPLVDTLVKQQADGLNDGLNKAVTQALVQMGFDPNQVSGLDQPTIDKLGHLIGANVNGKVNALVLWAAHNALQPIIPDTGAIKTSWDILGKPQPAGPATPQSILSSAAILGAAAGAGAGRAGGNLGAAQQIPLIGSAAIFGAAGGIGGGIGSGRPGRVGQPLIMSENPNDPNSQYAKQKAAANAAYQQNLAKITTPMRAIYTRWQTATLNDPTGNRQAAEQFGQQFLDTYGKAIASAGKKPKKPDSPVILDLARNIIGPAAISRDKSGVATLAKGAWDQIWSIYTQSEQATGKDQRDRLAKNTRDIIVAGAKDGSTEAAKAMTQIFMSDNQKAIQDAITKGHPNALYPLIEEYNKANPFSKITGTTKRQMEMNFEEAFQSWLKGGAADPTKPDPLKTVQTTIQGVVTDVGNSLKTAGGKVTDFANTVVNATAKIAAWVLGGGGGLFGGGGTGGSSPNAGGTAAKPLAGGAFFDTRGITHMTVGEAAGETVAVIKNPRRFMLPDMRLPMYATPGLGGVAGSAGRHTQIFADKIQVLGPSDERSLLERFAFLSNQ